MADETLSSQEYAELHGVSQRTVQRWVEDGLIFGTVIGRGIKIPFDEPPPTERQLSNADMSNVQVPIAITQPDNAGFPTDEDISRLRPESIDEEEEEEEDEEECRDPGEFDQADLRKPAGYATREEAEDYASGIPISTLVFKRCTDGLFQIAIEY